MVVHHRASALLALLLTVAVVLSACGGTTPAPAPAAPAAPAAPEAPAAEAPAPEAPAAEAPAPARGKVRQAFGGGPVGGAFQVFANAMALIMQDTYDYLDIAAEGTGGSGENLRGVNANEFQYGIVYSGDVALGREGALPEDPTKYTNVAPVAALYGGVIHLVVSKASGIETVADLPGKRIALGNAGSGAALSAERYFSAMGMLDQINVEYLGYSQAAQAMGDGQLDGFWILAAFPNSSVTEATTFTEIRLIDVYTPGVEAGVFEQYPFYTPRTLTGGAYPGVDQDVQSFQDTALLVSNNDVEADLVYDAVKSIFSDEGLKRMREAHPAAAEMSREGGITGISVPLHPGAVQYWQEVGTTIPPELVP